MSKTHFIKPIPANPSLFFHVIHKYPSAVRWSFYWPSILFFSQMFYVPFQLEHNFPELVSVCKPLEFFINIHVGEKLCQNTSIDWLSRQHWIKWQNETETLTKYYSDSNCFSRWCLRNNIWTFRWHLMKETDHCE